MQVILGLLSLFKDFSVAIAFALVESSRIKKRRAEDDAALAKTELRILQKTVELEKGNVQKDPVNIIDDYLSDKP